MKNKTKAKEPAPSVKTLLGGRKVIMTLIVLGTGVLVTSLQGDVPDNLMVLLQVILGGYVVGNIGEHAARAFRDKSPNGGGDIVNTVKEIDDHICTVEKDLKEMLDLGRGNGEYIQDVEQRMERIETTVNNVFTLNAKMAEVLQTLLEAIHNRRN